jgi:hypothetical protein
MADAPEAALAAGRAQSLVVRRYLTALERQRPGRGRRRTVGAIRGRLDRIEGELPAARSLRRLRLLQERSDLTAELEAMEGHGRVAELEDAFVSAAAAYGARKRISYARWRELGVTAAVLERAGVTR